MPTKRTGRRRVRRDWRMPDGLRAEIEPPLPPRKPHPLGCHNPRVGDRAASGRRSSSGCGPAADGTR